MSVRKAHILEEKWRSNDIKLREDVDFSSLLLSKKVLRGLDNAGFKKPSPIQLEAIPTGRFGKDLIVQAKSGTGKTLVFTIIALEMVLEVQRPQVLILSPTREIAFQICDVIRAVAVEFPDIKCGCFIGGRPVAQDIENIRGCQIVVGTPGRIHQLISMNVIHTGSIRLCVLDEADELMKKSFKDVADAIFLTLPKDKQIIATSATYPDELKKLTSRYFRNPYLARLNEKNVALLGTIHYVTLANSSPVAFIEYKGKVKILQQILCAVNFTQCLVFCNQISRVETLCFDIKQWGFSTTYISSAKEQESRLKALDCLKRFKCKVLVTSDLTARGIDAENVDLIINFDPPFSKDTYFHRVGRAGRYGSRGVAITFLNEKEEVDFRRMTRNKINCFVLPNPCPANLIELRPRDKKVDTSDSSLRCDKFHKDSSSDEENQELESEIKKQKDCNLKESNTTNKSACVENGNTSKENVPDVPSKADLGHLKIDQDTVSNGVPFTTGKNTCSDEKLEAVNSECVVENRNEEVVYRENSFSDAKSVEVDSKFIAENAIVEPVILPNKTFLIKNNEVEHSDLVESSLIKKIMSADISPEKKANLTEKTNVDRTEGVENENISDSGSSKYLSATESNDVLSKNGDCISNGYDCSSTSSNESNSQHKETEIIDEKVLLDGLDEASQVVPNKVSDESGLHQATRAGAATTEQIETDNIENENEQYANENSATKTENDSDTIHLCDTKILPTAEENKKSKKKKKAEKSATKSPKEELSEKAHEFNQSVLDFLRDCDKPIFFGSQTVKTPSPTSSSSRNSDMSLPDQYITDTDLLTFRISSNKFYCNALGNYKKKFIDKEVDISSADSNLNTDSGETFPKNDDEAISSRESSNNDVPIVEHLAPENIDLEVASVVDKTEHSTTGKKTSALAIPTDVHEPEQLPVDSVRNDGHSSVSKELLIEETDTKASPKSPSNRDDRILDNPKTPNFQSECVSNSTPKSSIKKDVYFDGDFESKKIVSRFKRDIVRIYERVEQLAGTQKPDDSVFKALKKAHGLGAKDLVHTDSVVFMNGSVSDKSACTSNGDAHVPEHNTLESEDDVESVSSASGSDSAPRKPKRRVTIARKVSSESESEHSSSENNRYPALTGREQERSHCFNDMNSGHSKGICQSNRGYKYRGYKNGCSGQDNREGHQDEKMGHKYRGYQDNRMGHNYSGFQNASMGHNYREYQNGSMGHKCRGYENGSMGHNCRGYQDESMGHNCRGYQDESMGHNCRGYQDESMGHNYRRNQNNGMDRNYNGYQGSSYCHNTRGGYQDSIIGHNYGGDHSSCEISHHSRGYQNNDVNSYPDRRYQSDNVDCSHNCDSHQKCIEYSCYPSHCWKESHKNGIEAKPNYEEYRNTVCPNHYFGGHQSFCDHWNQIFYRQWKHIYNSSQFC